MAATKKRSPVAGTPSAALAWASDMPAHRPSTSGEPSCASTAPPGNTYASGMKRAFAGLFNNNTSGTTPERTTITLAAGAGSTALEMPHARSFIIHLHAHEQLDGACRRRRSNGCDPLARLARRGNARAVLGLRLDVA